MLSQFCHLKHQRIVRYCEKIAALVVSLLISPGSGLLGYSIFPAKVLQKFFWLRWFSSCDLSINTSLFLASKILSLLTITLLLDASPFVYSILLFVLLPSFLLQSPSNCFCFSKQKPVKEGVAVTSGQHLF